MGTTRPLIECRVAYQPGGTNDVRGGERVAFAALLTGRLRQLVPHIFAAAGSEITLDHSNFRAWSETPLAGGEHRPSLLVEVFPERTLPMFSRLEPLLSDLTAMVAWEEALRAQRQFPEAGFTTLTVETRFPNTACVCVDIFNGEVTEGWGMSFGAGRRFSENDTAIQDIMRQLTY